eukprot:6177559-Pleurochrysis_carterae.AAC.5
MLVAGVVGYRQGRRDLHWNRSVGGVRLAPLCSWRCPKRLCAARVRRSTACCPHRASLRWSRMRRCKRRSRRATKASARSCCRLRARACSAFLLVALICSVSRLLSLALSLTHKHTHTHVGTHKYTFPPRS